MAGEPLKIIHTADFHLGITARNIIGHEVEEKRRQDLRRNVSRIFDEAIRRNVDLVLICGDVFHRSDPSNRDFVFFAKEVGKVLAKGIKVVIIAGNHDKPRTIGAQNPLQALVEIGTPNFYYIQSLPKEPLIIDIKNDKKVGIIPIPYIDPRLVREISGSTMGYEAFVRNKIKEVIGNSEELMNADYRILMAHLTLTGAIVKKIWSIYITEPKVSISTLNEKFFDYIALGHVHTFQKFSNKVVYPGSIERIDFSEIDEDKGFIYAEIFENSIRIERIPLECRRMISSSKISIVNSRDPVRLILESFKLMDMPPGSIIRLEIEADAESWREFERKRRIIEDYLFGEKKILGYAIKRHLIKMMTSKVEVYPQEKISLRKSILEYINKLRIDEEIKKRALELAEKIMDEEGIA